jgi:AcrR family transcriptional regulator
MQRKKDTVKELIDSSAMKVFSEKGYLNAKIADIAKESGVSVGNIYRYYGGKEDIFYGLISQDFFSSFKEKVFSKVASWKQREQNPRENLLADQQFIDSILKNKGIFLILCNGCKGTKYENFKSEMISYLTSLFMDSYKDKLNGGIKKDSDMVRLIYEKYIDIFSSVLRNAKNEEELREKLEILNQYHTHGITSFLSQTE